MPNPPSDDDLILYRRENGTNGTQYSCPTASAQDAYNWITANSPPTTIAAFITALGNALGI